MLSYAIKTAQETGLFDTIMVSTDDDEITAEIEEDFEVAKCTMENGN